MVTFLQFYCIVLICVLVGLIVTPIAIWLDKHEEKQKEDKNE